MAAGRKGVRMLMFGLLSVLLSACQFAAAGGGGAGGSGGGGAAAEGRFVIPFGGPSK